jgi:peroxiredoxin Q/BCP
VDAAREGGAHCGSDSDARSVALAHRGSRGVARTGRFVREARVLREARRFGVSEARRFGVGEACRVREARGSRDLRLGEAQVIARLSLAVVFALTLTVGCREQAPSPTTAASTAPSPVASAAPAPAPTPSASVAAPESSLLKEGDAAPALVATASNGAKVDLAALKGKHVVVYFYPKDDTPGCTKEACAFRDAWSKLDKGNVQVIGVSVDDNESHKKFAEKFKLPFPLVADPDQKICKSFGVPVSSGYASRVSFLVGPDGKIKKVDPKVDPGVHADEILTDAGVKS